MIFLFKTNTKFFINNDLSINKTKTLLKFQLMKIPYKNKLSLFIFIILIFSFFTSCSFIAQFFVINFKNNDVKVIIKFNEPTQNFMDGRGDSITFSYIDKIVKINTHTEKKLTKKLHYKIINTFKISIDIPKKSTILISRAFNKTSIVDSITLIENNTETKYSMEDIYKRTKIRRGFFRPFCITYKIK